MDRNQAGQAAAAAAPLKVQLIWALGQHQIKARWMGMSWSKLHSCGEFGQMLSQLREKPMPLGSSNLEVWSLITSCHHNFN